MLPSVKALLSNIIDYAGMFPPANLSLEKAIRNYARYRTEPESWMLGRFVCPAERLGELSCFVNELFQNGPPLRIAALSRGGKANSLVLEHLAADLESVAKFCTAHENRVKVEVIDIRLLAEQLATPETIPSTDFFLSDLAAFVDAHGPPGIQLYVEAAAGPDGSVPIETALRAIMGSNLPERMERKSGARRVGFKLRFGGAAPAIPPSPEQAATALCRCRQSEVPFKATASLHHALSRFDHSLGRRDYGFLNLFFAGLLSTNKADVAAAEQILTDEIANDFSFEREHIRWGHRAFPVFAIIVHRKIITSFGSCSFDEPRDDLRAMGLI
jgi:hypothetical protein